MLAKKSLAGLRTGEYLNHRGSVRERKQFSVKTSGISYSIVGMGNPGHPPLAQKVFVNDAHDSHPADCVVVGLCAFGCPCSCLLASVQ